MSFCGHIVASRWNHIENLDEFFDRVSLYLSYMYCCISDCTYVGVPVQVTQWIVRYHPQ